MVLGCHFELSNEAFEFSLGIKNSTAKIKNEKIIVPKSGIVARAFPTEYSTKIFYNWYKEKTFIFEQINETKLYGYNKAYRVLSDGIYIILKEGICKFAEDITVDRENLIINFPNKNKNEIKTIVSNEPNELSVVFFWKTHYNYYYTQIGNYSDNDENTYYRYVDGDIDNRISNIVQDKIISTYSNKELLFSDIFCIFYNDSKIQNGKLLKNLYVIKPEKLNDCYNIFKDLFNIRRYSDNTITRSIHTNNESILNSNFIKIYDDPKEFSIN